MITIDFKKEAINLKESNEEYMGGFGGRKEEENDRCIIILKKIFKTTTTSLSQKQVWPKPCISDPD